MPALALAIELLSQLPGLISAGIDVVDLINKTNDDLKVMQETGADPTAEQWEVLNNAIEELRASRPDVTFEGD